MALEAASVYFSEILVVAKSSLNLKMSNIFHWQPASQNEAVDIKGVSMGTFIMSLFTDICELVCACWQFGEDLTEIHMRAGWKTLIATLYIQ